MMLAKKKYNFDVLEAGTAPKRLLIFTEHINATYFISFDIPLRILKNQGICNFGAISQNSVKSLELDELEAALSYWQERLQPTAVVMSRYSLPHGEKILSFYRKAGIKIIYHIDDDLLDIPASLGQKIVQQHGTADVVAARRYLLEQCDLVYASTPRLANRLKEKIRGQQIIHGEIYASYLGDLLPAITERKREYPIIGYMGSKGHQEDLALVVPDIVRLMSEHTDLHFETFGTIQMPTELLKFSNRITSYGVQKDYWSFLARLKDLQWDIGIAPLVDTPFNHCKAPTKYIEYTSCNIPVVASNLSVYIDAILPGTGALVGYDWADKLSPLISSAGVRNQLLNNATSHCENFFSRTKLQAQLLRII